MSFGGAANILVFGLGLVAIFICLKKKEYFLPAWVVACFLVDPRSAGHVIPILLALLATIALSDMVFPWFLAKKQNSSESERATALTAAFSNRLCQAFIVYLFIAMLIGSYSSVSSLAGFNTLQAQDIKAMNWVGGNTPANSRFVVIGWEDSPWVSPLTEWFPALSGRYSLTTVQGREWLSGNQNITPWINTFEDIQSCLYQTSACLDNWAASHNEPFDYVYLSLHDPAGASDTIRLSSLYSSLNLSHNYELVLDEPTVKVYRLRK
jgi:hypothetical protein